MCRVIDFSSGDKDSNSDGTLFQRDSETLCLQDDVCMRSVPFIYKANWKR